MSKQSTMNDSNFTPEKMCADLIGDLMGPTRAGAPMDRDAVQKWAEGVRERIKRILDACELADRLVESIAGRNFGNAPVCDNPTRKRWADYFEAQALQELSGVQDATSEQIVRKMIAANVYRNVANIIMGRRL